MAEIQYFPFIDTINTNFMIVFQFDNLEIKIVKANGAINMLFFLFFQIKQFDNNFIVFVVCRFINILALLF